MFSCIFISSWQPSWAQATGKWYIENTKGASPEKRHESAFVNVADKFYLLGGRGTKTIQVYNPTTNTWSNTQTKTNDIHHFQAAVYSGKIYIIGALQGGYPDEDPVAHVLIYDPAKDQLTQGPAIPTDRLRGSAGLVVHQGKLYLIGGNRNGHSAFLSGSSTTANVAWFDAFDPISNTWQKLPDAPHARDHVAVAVIGDKLYVAGGRRSKYGTADGTFKDTEEAVDVYDFSTGKWLSGASVPDQLPTPRAGAAVAVLGNELLVMGGEVDSNPPSNLAINKTEALNPSTGHWRQLANLNVGRHATQAVLYQQDLYLAAGSKTRGGTEITPSEAFVEVFSYDGPPSDNAAFPVWTNVSNAPVPRSEAQMILYQDELYFFNGFAPNIKIENSCYKYNPKKKQWTKLASMPNQPNGKPWAMTHNGIARVGDVVWLIGGRVGNNPGPVTDKVWLYDISENKWSEGPKLPVPAGGGGVGRIGNKLHYVGGFDTKASCDVNHHLVYDLDNPGAGWQQLSSSPMPEPRNHFGTTVLNGKLYTIGGQLGHDGCGGGKDVKAVHAYDPASDQWTKLADLPNTESHTEPSTFAQDGKIYVVGGQTNGNKVHQYDPETNQWKTLADYMLPTNLLAPGVRILGDTLVVAVGGAPNTENPTNIVRYKTIQRDPQYRLSFNVPAYQVSMKAGQTHNKEVILSTLADPVKYTIPTANFPSWLAVGKSQGTAEASFEAITLTINTAGLAKGTYQHELVATASGFTHATLTVKVTVENGNPPPADMQAVYRINAGGNMQTVGGTTWEGCQQTGNCNDFVEGGFPYTENPLPTIQDVPPGLNQAIFHTEWTGGETKGVPPGGLAFAYNLPVANGDYLVKLYFAELNKYGTGLRTFDVMLEGQKVLSNFDIYQEAGGAHKAIVREFATKVTDGKIDIDFIRQVQNAKISAIEVLTAKEVVVPTEPNQTFWLEAECATVGNKWSQQAHNDASNQHYLTYTGTNYMNTPPAAIAENMVSFKINVADADNYRLLARIKATSGSDDSFWVRINQGTWIKWWEGLQTGNQFAWKEVTNSPFALVAGVNTIDFTFREKGAGLDKLLLTNTNLNPTSKGENASNCNTAEPPAPPKEGVVKLTLVNADNNQDLAEIQDGSVFNLNTLPTTNLNIRADTQPATVGSVIFKLTGVTSKQQTENKKVYALFGDDNNKYRAGSFNTGTHTLQATAYTQSKGNGTAYPAYQVSFTITNGNNARMMSGKPKAQPADVVAMQSNDLGNALIYPNPGKGLLFISLHKTPLEQAISISITDLQGKTYPVRYTLQSKGNQLCINTELLPAGVYFIHINQGTNHSSHKVIIE